MRKPVIDNEFIYKGYKCYVARHPKGQLLGYVVIDRTVSWAEVEDIEVHGGISFHGTLKHISKDNEFAIGFDCGHAFDYIPTDDYAIEDPYFNLRFWSGLEVKKELMHIVDQIENQDFGISTIAYTHINKEERGRLK